MTNDLWWSFYLHESTGIETRQPLVDTLGKLGLHILDEYISDPHYQTLFSDDSSSIYYEISNGDEESAYVWLGTKSDNFLPPCSPSARLNADRLLELSKACYHTLKPLYAFAETMNSFVPREDVDAYHITRICWAQFFGSAFVQNFGRNMLTNAPAWRNENLGDGGLLYVLAVAPYVYRGGGQCWQQAREYFTPYAQSIQWSDQLGDIRAEE